MISLNASLRHGNETEFPQTKEGRRNQDSIEPSVSCTSSDMENNVIPYFTLPLLHSD